MTSNEITMGLYSIVVPTGIGSGVWIFAGLRAVSPRDALIQAWQWRHRQNGVKPHQGTWWGVRWYPDPSVDLSGVGKAGDS